jgi:hypothetical protein
VQPDPGRGIRDDDGRVVERDRGGRALGSVVRQALNDQPRDLDVVGLDPQKGRGVGCVARAGLEDREAGRFEGVGLLRRRGEAVERRHGPDLSLHGDRVPDREPLRVAPGADSDPSPVTHQVQCRLHRARVRLRALRTVVVDDHDVRGEVRSSGSGRTECPHREQRRRDRRDDGPGARRAHGHTSRPEAVTQALPVTVPHTSTASPSETTPTPETSTPTVRTLAPQ